MQNGDQTNQPISMSDATVGILTALPIEYAACLAIFDPESCGADKTTRATTGQFQCRLCRIGTEFGDSQIVAITLLPDAGTNSAAIGANILLQHCPGVNHLVMCGIAGAVPSPDKPTEHVRLGDIVISGRDGVIQYDRGKQFSAPIVGDSTTQPFDGFEFTHPPRPPCSILSQIVRNLLAKEQLLNKKKLRHWEELVSRFQKRNNDKKWKYQRGKDILDDSDNGSSPIAHPTDNPRRSYRPRIFVGPIGTANVVLKDPNRRNSLRDKYSIKAVEMEGSGIADVSWTANIGYLVIRGTCDYCNPAKTKEWQPYAALVAAAFTRSVIESLAPAPLRLLAAPAAPITLLPTLIASTAETSTQLREHTNDDLSQNRIEVEVEEGTSKSEFGADIVQSMSDGVAISISDLAYRVGCLSEELGTLISQTRWREAKSVATNLEHLVQQVPSWRRDFPEVRRLLIEFEKHEIDASLAAKRTHDFTRYRKLVDED